MLDNKIYKFVFAKHDNLPQEYIFAVPEHMEAFPNDVLLVDTRYGEKIATATSHMIESNNPDALNEIAVKYGATLPLREVKQVAGRQIREYIERKTIAGVVDDIKELSLRNQRTQTNF